MIDTIYEAENFDTALIANAERELASFAEAVRQIFGAAQERLAVEDWVHEFEGTDHSDLQTADLRQVSIAAAARLSNRVWLLR